MNKWNRNYRLVWSESSGGWVVADELSTPKGCKTLSAVGRVAAAILIAGGMLTSAPSDGLAMNGAGGLAAACVGTSASIVAPLTGTCKMTASDNLTISNAGSISLNTNQVGSMTSSGTFLFPLTVAGAAPALNISNSGSIDLYAQIAKPSSTVAVAAVGGGLAGTLTNTSAGSITATLNIAGAAASSGASSSVYVRGLDFNNGGISGTLNNVGLIKATLDKSLSINTSSVPGTMMAEGINTGSLSGTLTNDGTISGISINSGNHLISSASITMTARGIGGRQTSLYNGTLTNNGNITANASNTGNVALSGKVRNKATALLWGESVSGNIINSSTGSITATANNTGSGNISGANLISAFGLIAGGRGFNIGGTISNYAFGGRIVNNGTISATATAPVGALGSGNNVKAVAMEVHNLTGVIDNYSNITAMATVNNNTGTSNAATAIGIQFGASASGLPGATGGILNNYGTISASATTAYAVSSPFPFSHPAGQGGLTVNNMVGGVIKGDINLNGFAPGENLNNAGLIELPSTGASSITGNYTQQTGGILQIDASSVTSSGYLFVKGTASFANSGTIDVNVLAGNTLATGNKLVVVRSNTTITAPAGGFTVTDNSATLDFTAAILPGLFPGSNVLELTVNAANPTVDTDLPVIIRNGPSIVNVAIGTTYTDAGVTANDGFDGDITANVVATNSVNTGAVGAYTVTYNVSDAAGHAAATVVRYVNVVVDVTPPVITINGANPISVVQNTTFTDPGVTAIDNVDGDISANVTTGGTFVNTSTPGTYTITYDVSDTVGNAATQVTRTVTVTAAPASGGGSTGGGSITDPYSGSSGGLPSCVTPSSGMLPTLLTMLAGLGLIRKRKK